MRSLQRFFVYLILLLGSITFLAPLLWMLSTGLKPIGQAMTMPPRWIPYRFFVEKDGTRLEVKPGAPINVPSYVAEIEGERHIVSRASVVNGRMKQQLANGNDDGALSRNDGALVLPVSLARLDRDLKTPLGRLVFRRGIQRVSVAAVFHDPAEGHLRGGAH